MSINCDVYLVHYEPLKDRLSFMKDQFDRLGIQVKEVIMSEPPDGWISDRLSDRKIKLEKFHNYSLSSVTKAEASLAWKHLLFLKKASEGNRSALVLEDDAILSDNFVEVVNSILENSDWDAVFPGSGCNLRKHGKGLIRVDHPASKCTDSYIVSANAAKALFSTMSLDGGISLAIDWELNYQMMFHDLRVFWFEPSIVRQGSQDGTMRSSINGKKENLYR